MLELPSVTLFCADCVDIQRAIVIVERCKSLCNFGAVKLLTSLPTEYPHIEIPRLGSLVEYSLFMLKRAVAYIDTPHALVVQHDGFIINADAWNPEWLKYDYMGPLFLQEHVGEHRVGSGGFSLRSKALMEFVAKRAPSWDGTPESTTRAQAHVGSYEDGFISHTLRADLKGAGFKFATLADAAKFAQGGYPERSDSREFYVERPFGFHGGWSQINRATGFVSPPPFQP